MTDEPTSGTPSEGGTPTVPRPLALGALALATLVAVVAGTLALTRSDGPDIPADLLARSSTVARVALATPDDLDTLRPLATDHLLLSAEQGASRGLVALGASPRTTAELRDPVVLDLRPGEARILVVAPGAGGGQGAEDRTWRIELVMLEVEGTWLVDRIDAY